MADNQDVEMHEADLIFSEVSFALVPSATLQSLDQAKIVELLTVRGATHYQLGDTNLSKLTHLISSTSDFPAYHDAVEGFIHVVKPDWVYHSVAKGRSAGPRQYSPDPCLFFGDVVVTCADDIPEGDKDAIIGGVLAFGGQYSPALSKVVTHIVALTMDNPECQLILAKGLKCRAVLPHWFDDCLKLGKKILADPYNLPNPSIFSAASRKPPSLSSPKILDGAAELVDLYGEPSDTLSTERQNLSVFRNKIVFFAEDLKLSSHLLDAFHVLITEGGGQVATGEEEADTVVCRFRSGDDYTSASQAKKDVGNLTWLYYLVNNNIWTSPTHRLLHYPIPRKPIPGFERYRIAVSNYTGEARIYLENLVKAAGGQYTKTMTQENTHLVTAHIQSEKCEAAREWNINMVNNLWLEESYTKCQVQPLTNSRYTTFPARTNLCETVGQTEIDRDAVERYYAPLPDKDYGSTFGRAHENGAAAEHTTTGTPDKASSHAKKRGTAAMLLRTPEGKENETPSSRGAKARAINKLHSMAPDIALFEKECKRSGGVVYGGRRVGDADRIVLDRRRSKEHSAEPADGVNDVDGADGADENTDAQGAAEERPAKKQKTKQKTKPKTATLEEAAVTTTAEQPAPRMNIIVTGYEPWTDIKTQAADAAALTLLNIHVVSEATMPASTAGPGAAAASQRLHVLVADKVLRTRKFVVAIAAGPSVVTGRWLEAQLQQRRRLPVDEYALRDADGERRNHFVLADGLARARARRDEGRPGVLAGRAVFCTEGVNGGFDALNEIVRVNGGVAALWKGRETDAGKILKQARQRVAARPRVEIDKEEEEEEEHEEEDQEEDAVERETDELGDGAAAVGGQKSTKRELHLVTDPKDKTLWPRFHSMAEAQGFLPRIVRSDWLLKLALSQQDLPCEESLFE